MEKIYDLIIQKLKQGMEIPLIRKGKYYTFIETTTTIVNKIFYDRAIHYRISNFNSKKITALFIDLTYEYYINNKKKFPPRDWYEVHEILKHEYKSRPCNYSVVQGLINLVLKK
ncbi:hypothetical protein GCM10011508_12400 [Flavobacterium lutivivi]|nr:hypothetical protein GCM10011508_12400 [Flavobacterium lutivivi]